jgi:SAM-dependent methyltransferase
MNRDVDPTEMVKTLGIDGLCEKAEEYFLRVSNPRALMSKPFSDLMETPGLLYKMGLLLSGLRLGKSMCVMDFGAGTCWFSRLLNQLQCSTISVDPSKTALKLGKKLFDEMPILGEYVSPPRFVLFDGRRIDLESESVDRIISFDAFHHVPNERDVLEEFFRVLRPGGIVGFCEPGAHHSKDPKSQYEMKNYTILENDLDLKTIKSESEEIGFTHMSFKLMALPELELEFSENEQVREGKGISQRIIEHLVVSNRESSVFYLVKGKYIPDSRGSFGLKHEIKVAETHYKARANEEIIVPLTITNAGCARWLHANTRNIGVTNIGLHLYDLNMNLLNLDFWRSDFDRDVQPGEQVVTAILFRISQMGRFKVMIDLVSEQVCWFETLGSLPVLIDIIVE